MRIERLLSACTVCFCAIATLANAKPTAEASPSQSVEADNGSYMATALIISGVLLSLIIIACCVCIAIFIVLPSLEKRRLQQQARKGDGTTAPLMTKQPQPQYNTTAGYNKKKPAPGATDPSALPASSPMSVMKKLGQLLQPKHKPTGGARDNTKEPAPGATDPSALPARPPMSSIKKLGQQPQLQPQPQQKPKQYPQATQLRHDPENEEDDDPEGEFTEEEGLEGEYLEGEYLEGEGLEGEGLEEEDSQPELQQQPQPATAARSKKK